MGYTKDQLLDRLKELQIDFDSFNHPAVMTVEAQAKFVAHISGGLSKNLFLKDKKHRYYLISALAGTNVDLKVLSQRLGLGKGGLRMAPEEALHELLQVPLGCVTPFALINDSARSVSLLLDQGFKALECCFFHPLTNDMTISLSPGNLDKFLNSIERKVSYVDLEANPRDGLGKDNPPDLVDLVPSEVCSLPDQTVKTVQNHVPAEKPSTNSANARPKVAPEKSKSTIDSSAGATNVSKFVTEVIDKTSAAILSELNKANAQKLEVQCSSVTDAVKKRITSDLENLAVMLKNAAYTEGFHSGLQSALPRKNL